MTPNDGQQRVSTGYILNTLGIPATKTNIQQMDSLIAAMRIFVERNEVHQDVWATADPEEQATLAAHKARRAGACFRQANVKPALPHLADEEALDGINYFAFLHRQVTGETP